jgi:predicted N-formylglutamate amidohydrolase
LSEPRAESATASTRLLSSGDPSPVIVINAGATSPFLLVGDHAGREIPNKLGNLGLSQEALDDHIAWDIGIAQTGLKLADLLGACFIRQTYSRLVVDCNRAPGAKDSILEVSDGRAVPGNVGLRPEDVAARQAEIYQPYQDRIAAELDRRALAGLTTVMIALHSFTPTMGGVVRPWRFGILHRNDSAYSRALLSWLRILGAGEVGDNEPYAMDDIDHTIPFHVDPRGLEYAEIEIRQDLLANDPGQTSAAHLLARLLPRALER